MTPTQAAGPGPNADPTLTSAALHRDLGDVYGHPAPMAAPLAAWRAQFTSPDARFQKVLRFTYGDRAEIIGERCALFLDVLGTFAASFGDEGKVCVVGVPSRINWEGHHVDHQGGSYNATTHCREMLLVARPRQDRVVRLVNANPERFCSHEFSLEDAPSGRDECRDWSNYVRGAFAALEQRFPGRQLLGADIAVASDIPVGASLSSSHALVLGSALCGLFSNGLVLDKREATRLPWCSAVVGSCFRRQSSSATGSLPDTSRFPAAAPGSSLIRSPSTGCRARSAWVTTRACSRIERHTVWCCLAFSPKVLLA